MARIRHIAIAIFVTLTFVAADTQALDEPMRTTLEGHQISLPGDDTSYCETDDEGEIVCGKAAEKLRAQRKERQEDIRELLDKVAEKLKELTDSFGDFDGMPSGESVARVLWAALIAMIVFITLLVLLRIFRRYRPNPTANDIPGEETLIQGLERTTRGQSAEQFAAKGDYGAAVHALLLSALRHLREEMPLIEIPSTTSREVVDAASAAYRPHLHVLVALAERSQFALEPVTETEYQDARRAHHALHADGVAE